MDLSALIFVALAVAWAVYLVPKAVRHHDEVARSRSVDRFSHTMRVLARREAVSARDSRLVVSPGRSTPATVVVTKESVSSVRVETAPPAPSTSARRGAARRRRRVLGLLLSALVAAAAVAVAGAMSWWWIALPAAVVVAWLVLCRVMVRSERRRSAVVTGPSGVPTARPDERGRRGDEVDVPLDGPEPVAEAAEPAGSGEDTAQVSVVVAEATGDERAPVPAGAAGVWDPVPMTLPTYVEKERAQHRTVRTIDLDSTGVWTSGRSEIDSALAREAEQAERAARAEQERLVDEARRATGS